MKSPPKKLTVRRLRSILDRRFGGILLAGSHEEVGKACALELLSVARGLPWSDRPHEVRSWDLRALNDIEVDAATRTECLLPVIAAYDGSLDWPSERQRAVASRLAILTIERLIAKLPALPDDVRERCRAVTDLAAAARAADSAARAADSAAVWAARAARAAESAVWAASAAAAARAAARAAAESARATVFRAACDLWMEAQA